MGLRGGGGNFGVVTSFEFQLHPIGPEVLAGPIFWKAEDAGEVMRFYRDFIYDTPDELGTVFRFGTIPPLPVIPEELHWQPAVALNTCWVGSVEEGKQVLQPLQKHGSPLIDLVASNFLDADDDSQRVREAYGESIYKRLTTIKAKFDPDNFFRVNQNVVPEE